MSNSRLLTNRGQSATLKCMFLFVLLSLFNYTASDAQAPVTVTIGAASGTASATNGPIWSGSSGSFTRYSRYAFIYTGGVGGDLASIPSGAKIIKVAWLRGSTAVTVAAPNTLNVWLSNTTATSLTNLTPWSTLVNGATQTYASTTLSILNAINTYVEVPFNVPGNDSFTYTGGNLQILTDWYRGGIQTGAVGMNFIRNTAAGKAIGANGNVALSGTTTLTNANSLGDFRPTLQITYVPVPACSGIPNTGNVLSSAASACAGNPLTLSLQNAVAGSGVSFVWQRATNSGFTAGLTNIGTSSTVSFTASASAYYRCITTCSGSGLSYTTPPLYLPLSPHYNCYCSSGATSVADEEIFNVSFGSLNNSSNCSTTATGVGSVAQSYSNYQSVAAPNVEVLSSVSFSIQVGTCLNQYPNRSAIFIDYNQNGVFETSEAVYSSSIATTGAHIEAGTITIPSGALTGLTGLRVITSEQGGPITSACGTYSWGETEDYLINITPTTICSGAPVPGATISSSPAVCTGNTVNLSVQFLTTGVGVTYQWYNSNGIIVGATSNSYVSSAIYAPTSFYCAVTCTNSGVTTNSTPITITMNSFIDCYCMSQAGSDSDDDIFSFTLNGASFGTNCSTTAPGPGSIFGRYSNFYPLGNIATLDLGSSASFDIEADDCDQAPYYSFGTAIWIDFNQNGSFNDPGERVYTELNPLEGPRHVIGDISIPCTANVGQTAMRVTIAEGYAGSSIAPCLLYGFGETEDYKILLKYPDTCSVASNPPGNTMSTVTSFCDSASSVLTLQNKCMFNNFFYQWYRGDYPGTIIAGATANTYTTPMMTATTTYYCSVSCGSSTVISTPITIPKVVLYPTTVASGSYCIGGTPVTLTTTHTYTGVPASTTYTYAPSTGLSSTTGAVINASPTSNTIYTVTATDVNGCSATTTTAVSATYLPIQLTASSLWYCTPNGSPVTLSASGAVTYSYSPSTGLSSSTGAIVSAAPLGTTTYIVTGVNAAGCYGKDSVIISTQSITTGSSSATACNTYTWVQNNNTAYTASGVYLHTFLNAGGCDSVHSLNLTITPCGNSIVNLKLFFQGYYDGAGLMLPALLNENAGTSTTVTDQITVELRDPNTLAVVSSVNTLLYTNGTAVCIFPPVNNSYYIVVRHRNNLVTWSAAPIAIGATPVYYDFSTAASKAYGNNQIQKEPGIWAMYSGDIQQDENIDLLDLSILEVDINNFENGYFVTDLNGDGNVDLLDAPLLEDNVNNFIYSIHP